ncbi:MAG: hypothetical protein A2854_03275 [Parcubacteria group bacterium RIFCSPHIGHO2_01_FULL_56_18]|nr:MAG: hypothetical protein A2854_03275 [Parcubacteria group bacterium RIFCSPHIGHO2_01_FULL_56_18]
MNNVPATTLVGWETRNWRHRERALVWCKDYGLKPLLRGLHIGKLYAKERKILSNKLNLLFANKTEKLIFIALCQSCLNASDVDDSIKGSMAEAFAFEIVQAPVIAKKSKKPNKH